MLNLRKRKRSRNPINKGTMKLRVFSLVCVFVILGVNGRIVSGQIVKQIKGKWYANGSRITAGDPVSPGTRITNGNRRVPNKDYITIAEDACSNELTIYCSKDNCSSIFYMPQSVKSIFFPCFLIRLFPTVPRGNTFSQINGIVEIKKNVIDLTDRVSLFDDAAGFVYFDLLSSASGELPRFAFDSNKTLKIKVDKPGLYKLQYKDEEYRILALESNYYLTERNKFEDFLKLVRIWENEKVEEIAVTSIIWQYLDKIASQYKLPNGPKEKKR